MSCEASHARWLTHLSGAQHPVGQRVGAPARQILAAGFDAARHLPVPTDPAELKRIDDECRLVWAQMQATGIKPPSHTLETYTDGQGRMRTRPGLPKDRSARQAYAMLARAVTVIQQGGALPVPFAQAARVNGLVLPNAGGTQHQYGSQFYERLVPKLAENEFHNVRPEHRPMVKALFDAIHADGVAQLGQRDWPSDDAALKAAGAFRSGELLHVAEVTNFAATIAREMKLSPAEERNLLVAATLHDKGKNSSSPAFAVHHLEAKRQVRPTLAKAGVALPEADTAAVENAILRHMAFGREDYFMRRMLTGYTAQIALLPEAGERDRRLDELFSEALLLTPEQAQPARDFLVSPEAQAMSQAVLAQRLYSDFPEVMRYPAPDTPLAEALADAANSTGEHRAEMPIRDRLALIEQRRRGQFAEALREADTGVLTSASTTNFAKYVFLTMQGKQGHTPITRCLSSWCGGYGEKGTALDAAESLRLPRLQAAAFKEIEIVRSIMLDLEQTTFDRWRAAEQAALSQVTDPLERQQRSANLRRKEAEFASAMRGARRAIEVGFRQYQQGHYAEAQQTLQQTDVMTLTDTDKVAHELSVEETQRAYRAALEARWGQRDVMFSGGGR